MKLKTKLLIAFLITTIIPFAVIGSISLLTSKSALSELAFGHLENMREVKKTQIRMFLAERKVNTDILMKTVANFRQAAFDKLRTVQEIKKAQTEEYFRKCLNDITVLSENANVRELRAFEAVLDGNGGVRKGVYEFHEEQYFGNSLRQFRDTFGYADLLLITKKGDIVYAVAGGSDLGQNLLTGPLKNSSLGRCFREGLRGTVIRDFEPYSPCDSQYMAFVAAPVLKHGMTAGVVALRLDSRGINTIMQRRRGMGKTGETYAAGRQNGRMSYRSDRKVREGRIGQPLSGDYVGTALSGQSGTAVRTDSGGEMNFISYDPLEIPGLSWAVITEMSLEEAVAPRLEGEEKDYFAMYVRDYGYDDLFLIHPGGHVFYSVGRHPDYGTNILTGAYSDSGLGRLVREIGETGKFGFADFEPYEPSEGKPAAFVAQPLVSDGNAELVVALRVSLDTVNKVMGERAGMGETGETYLVGPDRLMRSDSHSDPEDHSARASFANPEKGGADTRAARESLAGRTGRDIVRNYNGEKVLSAYTPLNVWGATWSLIAEIPTEEAFASVRTMELFMGMMAVIVILLIILLIFFIVRAIVRPIRQLRDAMRQMRIGELGGQIHVGRRDEIGDLAESFNEMSENLADSYRQVEIQNRELQRLDRLKDEFLANTSHELRTPLNGIIGIADSLIDGSVGPLTEAQRLNLSLIVSSGRRLTSLVNDILDFSKLSQGDFQLRLRPLDMRSVTDMVLMLSQTLVGSREIQLVSQIGADLPAVHADEDRVQQILHNLVGNAVKFTETGKVSVSARVRGEHLAVTVSDTGIGIPEESLGRIFESFEQADGSTAREYGGTGLGLAVTRNLVDLHGGEIRAESEPGKGSHFTFTLPVSGEKAEPAEIIARDTRVAGISPEPAEIGETEVQDAAEIPQEHLCDGEICRILAVDDEPVNLQVLKNQLTSEYYSVTLAANGREAIAALEGDEKFDLVLLDVMMPGMSGYEVCQRLRDMYSANELPVVMLTAKNQVDDLVAGFDSGASDYLTKPFSKQELIARVGTHVMLKHLHASRMRAETKAKLLAHEMGLAKRIQTNLIPEKPELPGYDIAASIEPADEVGGDYYDVISVAGHDWIVIGDVSGHGVPAGLVMMMVQTAIHTVLSGNPETQPSRLLSVINRTIYENIEKMGESKHMTIIVLAGGKDGKFSFSGSHEDILIRRAATGKVEAVQTDGMWIGLDEDISEMLSDDTLRLEPGDCMVLFTDGITEARGREDSLFGDERLTRIIGESGDGPASEVHRKIIAALESWEKPDDVTLVVVKRPE